MPVIRTFNRGLHWKFFPLRIIFRESFIIIHHFNFKSIHLSSIKECPITYIQCTLSGYKYVLLMNFLCSICMIIINANKRRWMYKENKRKKRQQLRITKKAPGFI